MVLAVRGGRANSAFQVSNKHARPRGARLPPVGCAPQLRRQAGASGIGRQRRTLTARASRQAGTGGIDRQLGRKRVVRKRSVPVILGSAGRRAMVIQNTCAPPLEHTPRQGWPRSATVRRTDDPPTNTSPRGCVAHGLSAMPIEDRSPGLSARPRSAADRGQPRTARPGVLV